jgi:hypothetical protein
MAVRARVTMDSTCYSHISSIGFCSLCCARLLSIVSARTRQVTDKVGCSISSAEKLASSVRRRRRRFMYLRIGRGQIAGNLLLNGLAPRRPPTASTAPHCLDSVSLTRASRAACGLALFFYSVICVRTWLNGCCFDCICNGTEHFITQI